MRIALFVDVQLVGVGSVLDQKHGYVAVVELDRLGKGCLAFVVNRNDVNAVFDEDFAGCAERRRCENEFELGGFGWVSLA